MNLESLKKRLATVKKVEWNGETIYLRKIGAADGMAMVGAIGKLKEQNLDTQQDREATINFHVTAISKSLADAQGNLQLNSEDAIESLKQLPFDDLVSLGDLVLAHSGFGGDEKKSTQPTNSPPSDCALHSEEATAPSTPTTSSAS
jgi:hypothetical protein